MQIPTFLKPAPGLLGAFLCLSVTACDQQESEPWSGTKATQDSQPPAEPAVSESAAAPAPTEDPEPVEITESEGSLRFIAFNIENWLTMDRYVNNKRVKSKPKPDSEKEAIVTLMVRYQPDVLGLCEIGSKEDLADLQSRLKAAGLDLPHSHHTGGADDTRRLAMLSRLPITSTALHEDLPYELEGRTMHMGRGILDATVEGPSGEIRFLGAHLKSKREIPEADQETMRRAEAHLLRDQATEILNEDPSTRLIVYGDMNDTRQASAIRTIKGPRKKPETLSMVFLRDSRGQTWTHHWSYQDVYSRFDYIFFSQPLKDGILWDECKVIDDPEWADASDHRALLLVLN